MTITPRQFQSDLLNNASQAMTTCKSLLLVAPTGSGKTRIGSFICQRAHARKRRVLFTVHRDFLLPQTADAMRDVGVPFGFEAPGYTPDRKQPIQIASIDALRRRLDHIETPDLVIVDESHHSAAKTWTATIQHFMDRGAKVLGLTATPIRLDGQGLGKLYEQMVVGPSVRWLIDNGYLCDYKAFAPTTPDMSGVHTKMGDFVRSETEAVVDKPTITGDAIREYKKHAAGKRAVVFCVSVEHAKHVCSQFAENGIPSAHLDGKTSKSDRSEMLAKFRHGEILILTSVEVVSEGFDLPSVECAILLRPTQSLSLFLQQIGRALRTFDGKDRAIILDHAGNLMRFGLPDQDREWSLEGAERRGKKKPSATSVPIRQCPKCFAVFPPAPVCPECGHVLPVQARQVEQVDGDLTELTPEMMAIIKDVKRKEIQRARTMEDLEAIAKKNGYSHGWAYHIFRSRQHSSDHRARAQYEAFQR